MKLNKIFFAIAVSVCVAAAGIAYIVGNDADSDGKELDTVYMTDTLDTVSQTVKETQAVGIYVYVCGHVNNPGIVCVRQGDRIYKAIELAGGMSEDADINAINQADYVSDGQKIYVPSLGENYTIQSGEEVNGLININTADANSLMSLPGIGESRAEAIISYRDTNGSFGTIEDIMNVAGIKEAAFAKIKDYICV